MPGLVAAFGGADLRWALRAARTLDSRGDALRLEGPWGALVAVGEADVVVDGPWVVATLGRLENLRQLTAELGGEDRPPTRPAEIAAHLIRRVGFERALPRLEGDVAVVAWDGASVWAARDRTGVRSLHVRPGKAAAVLSEPVSATPTPRPGALQQFVLRGWVPAPDGWSETLRLVAPGTFVRCTGDRAETFRWFTPGMPPEGSAGNRDRWRAAVENAVRLAMLRAGDDGAMLADGGGAASRLLASQLPDLPRVDLSSLRWDAEVFASVARELPMTTPVGDPRAVAWAWMARHAADRGAKALITGIGADALFGDRETGVRARLRRGRTEADLRFDDERSLDVDAAEQALRAAAPSGASGAVDGWVRRCTILPEHDLRALDVACGAYGLVGRAPFAGALLSEVVAQVPFGLVCPKLLGAPLLAQLSGVHTPHRPFSVPVGVWAREAGLFTAELADTLDGWIDPDHVRALVQAHQDGVADHGVRLWRYWALARWRAED